VTRSEVRVAVAAPVGVAAAAIIGVTAGWKYAPAGGWIAAAAVYLLCDPWRCDPQPVRRLADKVEGVLEHGILVDDLDGHALSTHLMAVIFFRRPPSKAGPLRHQRLPFVPATSEAIFFLMDPA
jgi:hypothetical protein